MPQVSRLLELKFWEPAPHDCLMDGCLSILDLLIPFLVDISWLHYRLFALLLNFDFIRNIMNEH
jgi:hypothetical protein